MTRILFAALIMTFLFACQEKPKNPVAVYGDTMINSYEKGKQAGEAGNLDAVKKALDAYHAANDKYPENLDEIKPLVGQNLDISKYDYNPQNGTVTPKAR
ncbi:MAG: hypothetical protein WA610_14020 [Thermodesulfovibrionales bacterium]